MSRPPREAAILCPQWYADTVGPPLVAIESELDRRFPSPVLWLARHAAAIRGLLLFLLARRAHRIAVIQKLPGTRTLLTLAACLPRSWRPEIDLLHVLPRDPPARAAVRWAYRLWFAAVERPAIRRSMGIGQVMTLAEIPRYAELYGVREDRFRCIPWAFSRWGWPPPPFNPGHSMVVASGRQSCDWETLFTAAEEAEWPLTVICGRDDLERVTQLNHRQRATVLCEIPRQAHDELLRGAAVYVLPLSDCGPSAGHVRLMAACDSGVPVVASRVPGLSGYLTDETAISISPGAPVELAEAIAGLLEDAGLRRRLRRAAYDRGRRRTYRQYLTEVYRLLAR